MVLLRFECNVVAYHDICPLAYSTWHLQCVAEDAHEILDGGGVICDLRDFDNRVRTFAAICLRCSNENVLSTRVQRIWRSDPAERFPRMDIRWVAPHSECAQRRHGWFS